MTFSKHPALHLIENFCMFYNHRDVLNLLSLFTNQPTISLWNSQSLHEDLDQLKSNFESYWKKYEKSKFSFSSVKLSELPSCWATCNFVLKSQIETDLYKYENLKGNLQAVKEGNTWKIDELSLTEKFFASELNIPIFQTNQTPFELYLS